MLLLREVKHYNGLSPQLKKQLEDKVKGFGNTVRYKFDIANENPDPDKKDGKIIYPRQWTLDPAVFTIIDTGDKQGKTIALVEQVDSKDGYPTRWRRIKIHERQRGILILDLLNNPEDIEIAMYLELHPSLTNGAFSDKNKKQVITRIDETENATQRRIERDERSKARSAATTMSVDELKNFASAMMWDETEKEVVLRDMVEDLAETQPVFFNEIVAGKTVEYRAAVKRAMDKKIIAFDPADYRFYWTGNTQTIVALSPAGDKTEIEKFAEWLQTGDKGTVVYKKIKELLGTKEPIPA